MKSKLEMLGNVFKVLVTNGSYFQGYKGKSSSIVSLV